MAHINVTKRMTVNLYWEPKEESRRLIAILHPTGVEIHTDGGDWQPNRMEMTVDEVPEWMKPDALAKPLPPVQMLKKNLAQEPWFTMHAMCDAMEETNDPLAGGWRMIAEKKIVPISNTFGQTQHSSFEWREDIVGKETWKHHVLTVSDPIQAVWDGVVHNDKRLTRKFFTVMAAWEALAIAWSETGGK